MTDSQVKTLAEAARLYEIAVRRHYDRHSRHFGIEDCRVDECRKAFKAWKKAIR